MRKFLEKTSYENFIPWLCYTAEHFGFIASYDQADLIEVTDDVKSVSYLAKQQYPLKVYLSKIQIDGRTYDHDGYFLIGEVGDRLVISLKPYSDQGLKNLNIILKEININWNRKGLTRIPKKHFVIVEPGENSKREDWFEYYFLCRHYHEKKITHIDIAKKLNLSHGTVRRLYSEWIDGIDTEELIKLYDI